MNASVQEIVHVGYNVFSIAPESDVSVVRDGSSFDLQTGDVTVSARSLVKGNLLPNVTAFVLGGQAAFLRSADRLTVVALTAPVLLEAPFGRALLAPGEQLIIAGENVKRSTVPSEWVAARRMTHRDVLTDRQTNDSYDVIASTLASQEKIGEDDLGDFLNGLQTVSGRSDLAPLGILALLTSSQSIDASVSFAMRERLRLIEDIRKDIPLALVEIARFTRRPIPAEIVTLFGEEVLRTAALDSTQALGIIERAADASVLFQNLGYPLQSDAWAEAVRSSAKVLRPMLVDASSRERLVKVERIIARIEHPIVAEVATVATRSQKRAASIDSNELLGRTWSMLRSHGALLTPETTVTIDSDDPARAFIRGFFHEDIPGLRSYDALYDPTNDDLILIRDGERLPNPVKAAEFFR